MGARHADETGLQLVTAHALRSIDGVRDAADGLLHVDDHAATQTFGRRLTDADEVQSALRRRADDAADLGCADLQCCDVFRSRQKPVLGGWLERASPSLFGP